MAWSQYTLFSFPSAGVTCNEWLLDWATLENGVAIRRGKRHKSMDCSASVPSLVKYFSAGDKKTRYCQVQRGNAGQLWL